MNKKSTESLGSAAERANIKILLVEDAKLQRAGYKTLLNGLGYNKIFEAVDAQQALHYMEGDKRPNVLLCDLKLPPTDRITEGINLLYSIQSDYEDVRIIAYSMGLNGWALRRVLEMGVSCLHPQDWNTPKTIDVAIHLVLQGWMFYSGKIRDMLTSMFAGYKEHKPPLTYHETRIAALHLQRMSGADIKKVLGGGSERVIGNHITDIYRKASVLGHEPGRFMDLLDWFEQMCADYGFTFDPYGHDINLEEVWDPSWPSPKKRK
jgi:DNA-binding NarL/FixJ family response regulator